MAATVLAVKVLTKTGKVLFFPSVCLLTVMLIWMHGARKAASEEQARISFPVALHGRCCKQHLASIKMLDAYCQGRPLRKA